MPWVYSNAGATGSHYTLTNYLNQDCAAVTLPVSCAVTQLTTYAGGYSGSVSTRLAIWYSGGSVIRQSNTFSMSSGLATRTQSITPIALSSGTYWVGLYRNPTGAHIIGTRSGASGYQKTNTAGFPNISSMSGYSSWSDSEGYVGAFYITAPSACTGASTVRNSDTSISFSWTNHSSSDQPYTNLYLERWDNITNSWYSKATLSSSTTSYTDTSVIANRYYRYRVRAYNAAGYSSYLTGNYINTTPAAPTNVVATRLGSTVVITWDDNATNEDQYEIARRESLDGGETWEAWDYSTIPDQTANSVTVTDTSPYTYGQYAVRAVETSQSLNSSYVWSNEVVTVAPPDPPTNLLPNLTAFDADNDKEFSWTHNPTDGTAQTKFSIIYKVYGGSYPGTPQVDEEVSTSSTYTFTGSTFTNGTVYIYKVKTWGEDASASDWSAEYTFTAITTPVATITSPGATLAYSSVTLEWGYTQADDKDQTQYLTKLFDSNDVLLESKLVSSIVENGNSDSCTFDYVLENETSYKITLQVKEENGLWSEEVEVEFTTDFIEPPKPTIVCEMNTESGYVTIDITNPSGTGGDGELEVTASQDSFLYNQYPDTNYNDNDLSIYYGGGNDFKAIVLDFESDEVLGKEIVSATLTLQRKSAFSGDMQSEVRYIKTAWNEATATYNSVSPHVDATGYGSHSHAPGDTEIWDITNLISAIANGTITDFHGLAIVPSGTGNPTDAFYDIRNGGYEPKINISYVSYADTEYNKVYKSVDDGESYTLLLDNVPINTSVIDYTPNLNGDNKYYISAISAVPSSSNSEVSEVSDVLHGYFMFNSGADYEDYIKIYGDISLADKIERESATKKYEGRSYPVRYQSNNYSEIMTFSGEISIENYNTLNSILSYEGNLMYRDWRGRRFNCNVTGSQFQIKDSATYQFSCNIERVDIVE